ncbi:MAG: VTT domain-containing protein [Candidatus Komeilibacteria bacterium]|nr:VTT domain-containing protein [Candidatus Komeilibacteria bacterium]
MLKINKTLLKDLTSGQAWLVLAFYLLLIVGSGFVLHTYVDREFLRQWVLNFGAWGPAAYGLFVYLYVIVAPFANTPIHMASGYIFGGHVGLVINFIATTAALFTIILLVKRYGRPLLERFVAPRIVKLYDHWMSKVGPLALFGVFVFPFTPDDELTYLVAGTAVSFKRFILPVVLGNLAKSTLSYLGDEGFAGLDYAVGARVIIFIIGFLLIGYTEYLHKKKALT